MKRVREMNKKKKYELKSEHFKLLFLAPNN